MGERAVINVSRTADQPLPTSKDRFVFKNRTRFIILPHMHIMLIDCSKQHFNVEFYYYLYGWRSYRHP
ncbi:hypothetical protein KIN20_001939 [Parelaphostrongylus tenuis]|uniref:Uncharacterized protein n=1 Tax=Parelaphostrongylus tenuis TaxID=148309 RepID=A0AAD5QHF1_PARTN|nr:hypothetical protein KIN20_001939 [Parelaphostrongylus tenuis]